jgi:hypothetical protein
METTAVIANSASATRSIRTTLKMAMERKAKYRPMCGAKASLHRKACAGLRVRREARSALESQRQSRIRHVPIPVGVEQF